MAPVKIDRKLSFMCLLNEKRQCHGFSWVPIFSSKSSNAKYKTLGTSQANSGGKNSGIILREARYSLVQNISCILYNKGSYCKFSGDLKKYSQGHQKVFALSKGNIHTKLINILSLI